MKYYLSPLLLLTCLIFAVNVAFAGDLENAEPDESCNVIFACKLLAKTAKNGLDKLASPSGAVAVASTLAILSALSDFFWAFNWQKHTGCSQDTHDNLQEWGGLTAAMECVALGLAIPVGVYVYKRKAAPAVAQGNDD
jgi:hypothetical protein